MKKLNMPVLEFRPDHILTEGKVYRYNNGNWIEDDGEYDILFVSPQMQTKAYVQLKYYENVLWSYCKKGNWTAYVDKHPNGNAWHYVTKNGKPEFGPSWHERDKHPNIVVSRIELPKFLLPCGNGRSTEFNVMDKTILAGLLRERDTKKVIKPPKLFKCCYCGDIDWKSNENIKK